MGLNVLGFHINKVVEAYKKSESLRSRNPNFGTAKMEKLIKLNLNDLIKQERRNSVFMSSARDQANQMKETLKDSFLQAAKQTALLLNNQKQQVAGQDLDFLKNFTTKMLQKHIEDLEMSILNLDFEKGLEALSLLEMAKQDHVSNFKQFGLFAKFLKLKKNFLSNVLREKLSKQELILRIDMLYQTGYVDIAEQLFYNGFSLILDKRRKYVFKNYQIESGENGLNGGLARGPGMTKPGQNPYLMPDSGTEDVSQVMNTEMRDQEYGMGLEQSQFGWSNIGGNLASNEPIDYNFDPDDGTINEKDIKNYVKAIFDLVVEMIDLQKHKFNFSSSIPLTGPNFKNQTKAGQKRKITWFNKTMFERKNDFVEPELTQETEKNEVETKEIFTEKTESFEIGHNFGLWFTKEIQMCFNQLFMNLSDQILSSPKVLNDAIEVVKISLGEYDSVGLSSEFLLEEFISA